MSKIDFNYLMREPENCKTNQKTMWEARYVHTVNLIGYGLDAKLVNVQQGHKL